MGYARRVLGHHRRAHGGAHARRTLRRQPHGRDRDCGQGRARGGAAHLEQRCRQAGDGAGPLRGADHLRGDLRRRHARLSNGAESLHAGGQRLEHRQGLRLDRRADQGSGRRRRGRFEQPVRADRDPGAGGARRAAAALFHRAERYQVLLVHVRRGRRRARADLAHGVHRRRWLRDLRAAEHGRPGVAGDPRVGPGGGRDSLRPGRTRHAAPRGRDAPVRQ